MEIEHLEETKRLIIELADRVMLNKDDLSVDNRMFSKLHKVIDNYTLVDYLVDLANDRIENLQLFINDKNKIEDYKKEVKLFLKNTVLERI